jgi:hypothetical protein
MTLWSRIERTEASGSTTSDRFDYMGFIEASLVVPYKIRSTDYAVWLACMHFASSIVKNDAGNSRREEVNVDQANGK